MIPLRGPALICATLLLAAACGSGSAGGPAERGQLLSTSPAPGADCAPETYPAVLPGAATIVDSAQLVETVRALARSDSITDGYVLLTMAFDTSGANSRRQIIEHSGRATVADSVQRLVFAALRKAPSSEQEWGVRLRIDFGDPIGLQVGRREFCPASPLDRTIDDAMAGFNPSGVRYRQGRRERVLLVRTAIDTGGFVYDARIERGELPGSPLERDLYYYLRQFRFRPSTVDGIPTNSALIIPVVVRS
jgi:hypothetical protein